MNTNGYKVLFGADENVLQQGSADDYITMGMH